MFLAFRLSVVVFLATVPNLLAEAQTPARVTVTVHNVAGSNGVVRGTLCDDAATFANNCATMRVETPPKEGSIDLVFPSVPPGTYGLVLYHDQDGDGRFSIFSEPMALGNNSRDLPPIFDTASLKVTGDLKTETSLFNALQ